MGHGMDGKFGYEEVSIRRCKGKGAALLSQDEGLAQEGFVKAGITCRPQRILPVGKWRDIATSEGQIASRGGLRKKEILNRRAVESAVRAAEEVAVRVLRHDTHPGAEVESEVTEPGDYPAVVRWNGAVSASISAAAIGANDELTGVLRPGALPEEADSAHRECIR